jgi:hypothetical protein
MGVGSVDSTGGGSEEASESVTAVFEACSVLVIAACDCKCDWEDEGRAV